MVRRKKHRNPMTLKSRNYSVLGVSGKIGGCKDITLIWSAFFRIEPQINLAFCPRWHTRS